jgi:membrane protein DedA with SNARE-associated domain
MSVSTFCIFIAVALLSCLSCYWLGQENIRHKLKRKNERRRRWVEFEDED